MLRDVLKNELNDVEVKETELLELEEELSGGCGAGVNSGNGQCNGSCGTSNSSFVKA